MKATEKHLLELLSNNDVTFFIPPYQRNYECEEEQCQIFLNDILKVALINLKGEIAEHFFGTVVYVQNEVVFGQPSKLVLTDGQQRITTTMLFLVAIRDIIPSKDAKEFINTQYLTNSKSTDDHKIKLKQVETDWESYLNIILKKPLTTEQKQSSVYKNYQFFKRALAKLMEDKKIDILTDLITHGLNKFSIVTIKLEPEKNKWENPQEVFESMNSLGKPLSLADLVRNYLLLGQSAEEQDVLYKTFWMPIEKRIPEQISHFIRDFMQLKKAKDLKKATANNYKELYMEFKHLFKNTDASELLNELQKYSTYYAYIVLGTTTNNSIIDSKLADLRMINVTICYSFLLDIISAWDNEELTSDETIDILDALITFFLRRRIMKLSKVENKVFPALVKEHHNLIMAENKKQKMFEILANQEFNFRLPNDFDIKHELSQMNFYNFNQSKFILSLIEEKLSNIRPNKDVQIEHIMPQHLTEEWINELGEDAELIHQEFLDSIGNLTLVQDDNEISNNEFTIKKELYNSSVGFEISKNEVINRNQWNKDSITNRQQWVASFIANQVLPIPEQMKNKNNYRIKKNGLSFIDLRLIGKTINFIHDKSIKAEVLTDNTVMFEGQEWKLSPLTREIETRRGTVTASGAYQGAQYWEFEGIKLADIM